MSGRQYIGQWATGGQCNMPVGVRGSAVGRRAGARGPSLAVLATHPVQQTDCDVGYPARVRRGAPATWPSGQRAELRAYRFPQRHRRVLARRVGCEAEKLGCRCAGRYSGGLAERPVGVLGSAAEIANWGHACLRWLSRQRTPCGRRVVMWAIR